jgi:hypothetical protein
MADAAKFATVIVLAIVAVVGLALVLTGGITGNQVYQQPGYRLPIYLQTSVYLPDFDLCQQYLCQYGEEYFYAETEPAFTVGTEELTGNLRCGCSDGRTFIVRPDLIYEGTYG